jgi:hypothetical protein
MQRAAYFPSAGHWEAMGTDGEKLVYVPDHCFLPLFSDRQLEACVLQRSWKRIVTLGDSLGKRHYLALLEGIMRQGFSCRMLREEATSDRIGHGFLPDPSYFTAKHPEIHLNMSTRSCRTCGGKFSVCEKNSTRISVEHLGLPHLDDRSLAIPPKYNFTLDFYFKVHLRAMIRRTWSSSDLRSSTNASNEGQQTWRTSISSFTK